MTELMHTAETHAGHDHGWLGHIIEELVEHLPLSHPWKEFLVHIISDTVLIFALLLGIMLVVHFFAAYLKTDRLQEKLKSLKSVWGFGLAILLGLLSPFCSCSTIPVLMGFLSVGVPVSVCLCYLSASSMLNITGLLSLFAITGWQFALLYIGTCLILILISSLVFSIAKLDGTVKAYHGHAHHEHDGCETFWGRLKNAWHDTMGVFRKSALWVILGVILSAAIMAFVPPEVLLRPIQSQNLLSVLLACLIGIPLHSDIFSIAPIIQLLRNFSFGLALSFVVATMAISLPSVVMLTRAIKTRTVLFYCGVISATAVLLGFVGSVLLG